MRDVMKARVASKRETEQTRLAVQLWHYIQGVPVYKMGLETYIRTRLIHVVEVCLYADTSNVWQQFNKILS